MKTKILNVCTLVVALCGTLLTFADTQQPISQISPWIADKWPLVICAVILIRELIRVVGDYFDDGIINQSFKVLLAAAVVGFLFAGCTVTGGVAYGHGEETVSAFVGVSPDRLPRVTGFPNRPLSLPATTGFAK